VKREAPPGIGNRCLEFGSSQRLALHERSRNGFVTTGAYNAPYDRWNQRRDLVSAYAQKTAWTLDFNAPRHIRTVEAACSRPPPGKDRVAV
jgi:hypothetical protein